MDWIRIDIHPRALTETEALVFDLIQQGLNYMQIAKRLHLSFEYVRDIIYEIRKQEAIIMGKLSNTEKAAIFQSWKNGTSQTELAAQYSVSVAAISQLIKRLGKAENEIMQSSQTADAPKPGKINEDFDAAVNQMIADAKAEKESALAEKNSTNAEKPKKHYEKPIISDSIVERVPDSIIRTVKLRIRSICDEVSRNSAEIERLSELTHALISEAAELTQWLEAHL